MMMLRTVLLLFTCLVSAIIVTTLAAKRSYTVATYEHARYGTMDDLPSDIKRINLERYIKAAEVASSKGADIILYPEYGLFFDDEREGLKNYIEHIPDPKKVQVNPCEEAKTFSERPILYTLSCTAKNNSITVVANMGDIQDCLGESDCPEDSVFQYNTNVVFDKNGTLILKYHKEHLFFELGYDLPKQQQDPTFKTDFGTFATYICFDIIYERMNQVAKWPEVDAILFSTEWFEVSPQYTSVPFWQGWALGNNATLIVSNLQVPGIFSVGSGVFHGQYGVLEYTCSPDGISKLIVAKIPVSGQPIQSEHSVTAITDAKVWDWQEDGETIPKVCSRTLLNDTDNWLGEFRCIDETTASYTFVKLSNPSGYVEACNNGLCCSVNYTVNDMKEDYYLGVLNGTYNSVDRYYWCEENCFIARCDEVEGRPCSTFPRRANTIFYDVEMRSNFSTQYIYPSVVSSRVRLVPMSEWEYNVVQKSNYESKLHFHSKTGEKLINAGFKARCYQRDPPFVR